jgi:preprotein translocase subunit SecY
VTERRRLLALITAIPLMMVGSRITLPGVNATALQNFIGANRGGGLFGLYELISQGGLKRGAILALGIMPYLTARVYLRMWRAVNPKSDPTRVKTRLLTAVLSLIQSAGLATFLQRVPGVVAEPGPGFIAKTVVTLTAASLVVMWFGEHFTEPDDDDLADDLSALPERPEASPALIAPASPASQPVLPRPSSDAETLRTPR